MFGLTSKLAVSNLIKNRRLYYPFSLAAICTITIHYIFMSLALNPSLKNVYGAGSVTPVLGLGVIIVSVAAAIILFYANSFVMKNRSREFGLYGILGLEKKHIILMAFFEIFLLGLVNIGGGVGFGFLLDKLLYAFLLKVMKFEVVLTSTFQPVVLIRVVLMFAAGFFFLWLVNSWRILRMNLLDLVRESAAGEKKGRFLLAQTILGLALTGVGYYMALTVTSSLSAIIAFFNAVLLVIAGTYLLFNAGITVFLNTLKKNKGYYYQPNNMISLSNLIFRMRKNATGLATISILSTMVLVTLVGGVNIYVSSQNMINRQTPQDFSLRASNTEGKETVEATDIEVVLKDFAQKEGLETKDLYVYAYKVLAAEKTGNNAYSTIDMGSEGALEKGPSTAILIFNASDYKQMTGKKITLSGNQALVYTNRSTLEGGTQLTLSGQTFQVTQWVDQDFSQEKIPNSYELSVPNIMYLVLPDDAVLNENLSTVATEFYGGFNTDISKEKQLSLRDSFSQAVSENLKFSQAVSENLKYSYLYPSVKAEIEVSSMSMVGSIFFIGILLAVVFMIGAILIIYYKQISEGYEDRDRFIILQKVGLDKKQTQKTIRKQIWTVFFLPIIFSFCHLAGSYHMISLILKTLGVYNSGLMLLVTLIICSIFLVSYIGVFLLTSRSYRKIVTFD